MQFSFICILLTPSKTFFSVEQTMIEPSICYEVKYSERPRGGQERPSGTSHDRPIRTPEGLFQAHRGDALISVLIHLTS